MFLYIDSYSPLNTTTNFYTRKYNIKSVIEVSKGIEHIKFPIVLANRIKYLSSYHRNVHTRIAEAATAASCIIILPAYMDLIRYIIFSLFNNGPRINCFVYYLHQYLWIMVICTSSIWTLINSTA